MRILGIESSCDETAMAIYCHEGGLLGHVVHSQLETHRPHGGVVPELASRDHLNQLLPLLMEVLAKTGLSRFDLSSIAYTAGPGLIGALLTGACFAKALAFALDIPALAIHHLEAHILVAILDNPEIEFPFMTLLVSGGHTQLIEARALGDYRILGDTLDDAAGEAFDKTAKLMGIPYPGGAILAKWADAHDVDVSETSFKAFPRPMTNRPGLDFSFSGLKTHVAEVWRMSTQDDAARGALAHAFQSAVVDTLVIKASRAIRDSGIRKLILAGGVGANRALRQALSDLMVREQGKLYVPRMEFCTDNGAMVAYAGYLQIMQGKTDASHAIEVRPRWPLCSS